MIEIRTLKNTSIRDVHQAVTRAFADYAEPYHKTLEEQEYLMQRRGYYASLSVGAFNNDELVSFTLNGIDGWNGIITAYDTGTGTVKEYRKQGLAEHIFQKSLPALKSAGVGQYLLEVIKINSPAIKLYEKMGFETTRELDYYVLPVKDIQKTGRSLPQSYTIQQVEKPDHNLMQSFWAFEPAWQNSLASVKRKKNFFTMIGAYKDGGLVGYGMVENHTGDIPQIAVAEEHRGKGVGTAIFNELVQNIQAPTVRLINADASFTPFQSFMASFGLQPGHGQYEMLRRI